MNLSALPKPAVIEELEYETLLAQNIAQVQLIFPAWKPIESDDWMVLIESFTYKEMFLRARINEAIKAMLLPTSTGTDLDNFVAGLGVERLPGAYPYAQYEFELSRISSSDVIIPAGLSLISDDGAFKSRLKSNLTIVAGEIKAVGVVELESFIEFDAAKTENITTPLPYVLKAKSLEPFANGSRPESDEELRERYLLSLSRFSTAGSVGSYIYHSMSADERVDDVSVVSPSPGVVNVYLASADGVDEQMIDRVGAALNHEKVRPLTDTVNVTAANPVNIIISASVTVFDLSRAVNIESTIRTNLNRRFRIKQNFTLSDIIRSCHVDGVYKVIINEPTSDVIATAADVIIIDEVQLSFEVIA